MNRPCMRRNLVRHVSVKQQASMSMKRDNYQNLTKRKSYHRKPSTTPVVIWSNSAYAAVPDDQSSVASNELPSSWSSPDHQYLIMCDEEIRLREELGREIEKELERELMEGIRVLVRRLSDLKAKQFLRDLGDPRRVLRSDDRLTVLKKKYYDDKRRDMGDRRERNWRRDLDDEYGYLSDAESRTAAPEVKKNHRRDWGRR